MEVVQYTPDTKVSNLEVLPRGTGAKYLEVIRDHNGGYVAAQWRRSMPKSLPAGRVLIRFGK